MGDMIIKMMSISGTLVLDVKYYFHSFSCVSHRIKLGADSMMKA